jgi:glycosyltransferase involved in cell wall biosynthesis
VGKLLLVTYDYPPVTSAGMYRMVGMSKYLAAAGWDITVLTVKTSFVHSSDESLRLIPDNVKVVRTPSFEARRAGLALARVIEGGPQAGPGTVNNGVRWRSKTARLIRRATAVVERLTAQPDPKAGWTPFLFFWFLRALQTEKPDVVLSSSPPHSLHIPLYLVRLWKRFRWIVDFRDPWTSPSRGSEGNVGFGFWRTFERRILARSDRIVANTEGNRLSIERDFGGGLSGKIRTITNGFDTNRDRGLSRSEVDLSEYDFVYMGHLYPMMLDSYIDGIRKIRDENRGSVPRLCVFGRVPSPEEIEKAGWSDVVEHIQFKSRVSFDESLAIIGGARCLLLLVPHGPGFDTWVPSKLYPYLFCGRPILVLAPEGDATRIVRETGRGDAVTARDSDSIADGLIEFIAAVDAGRWESSGNRSALEHYTMNHISKEMHNVIKETLRVDVE